MTLRNCLIGMGASAVLCFAAWIMILNNVDPATADWRGLSLFYLSLFFALVSFFTLLVFFVRSRISSKRPAFSQIGTSFRQGIFFSAALVGALILQSFRMLDWRNGLLLLVSILILEFYFAGREGNA